MFLHRVDIGGMSYAVVTRSPDRPMKIERKEVDKKEVVIETPLFNWATNFVCPWKDFAACFPALAGVKTLLPIRAVQPDKTDPFLYVYRYPEVKRPEGLDPEAHFIECPDPSYIFASSALPAGWSESSPSVGFTGTTLAKITISRAGWESVFPTGPLRFTIPLMQPGAEPIKIAFERRPYGNWSTDEGFVFRAYNACGSFQINQQDLEPLGLGGPIPVRVDMNVVMLAPDGVHIFVPPDRHAPEITSYQGVPVFFHEEKES
jgi:hypothetical protein